MKTWFVCLGVAAWVLIAGVALAEEAIVLTNGEWPPFFSEALEDQGVGSRICKEAFARARMDVKYRFVPWKRGLQAARTGEATGSVGWRKTPERTKLFYFSDPILTVSSVLFHRQGSHFDWQTLDDIGPLTVGATLGYAYTDILQPYVEKHGGKLEIAPSDEINMGKLAAGRIDVFPCAQAVGSYLIDTKLSPRSAGLITHHPKPLLLGGIHLIISKDNPDGQKLITRFNAGLRELSQSGLYDQYIKELRSNRYRPGKTARSSERQRPAISN